MTAFQASLDLGIDPEPRPSGLAVTVALVDELPRLVPGGEPRGVVYTRSWVVDLILDLSGYRAEEDLVSRYAVEPSAGEGAFLLPMVRRLMGSLERHGRVLADARGSIRAYELDGAAAARAVESVVGELRVLGVGEGDARDLAGGWVVVDDYLLASPRDRRADLVVGNPPYIRYDDMPPDVLQAYRRLYPAMIGRSDIYVGFIEAGLRQLNDGGRLSFICADRWMRSAYGGELRRIIAAAYGVEAVIEMHDAPAFEEEVAAYPAVVVLRRARQGRAIVASAGPGSGRALGGGSLADAVTGLALGRVKQVPGFEATAVEHWFQGSGPWPALEPHQLSLLQRLEEGFAPLEDENTGTKIGIGVATGADKVFITTDPALVESDRLLPLAMSADTRQGTLKWSGHYLVDPWAREGLVDLDAYPRLRAYLAHHKRQLQERNVAQRIPRDWYRTIDRVRHELAAEPKLYFPDMKIASNPVLDKGGTYPHHNLYYLTSRVWDLEVLGGLLLSRVAQLFIEAYCVRMRGGTLRFQAQYLRRIRVPDPDDLSEDLRSRLREAFRSRDADAATAAAIEAYRIADEASVLAC